MSTIQPSGRLLPTNTYINTSRTTVSRKYTSAPVAHQLHQGLSICMYTHINIFVYSCIHIYTLHIKNRNNAYTSV